MNRLPDPDLARLQPIADGARRVIVTSAAGHALAHIQQPDRQDLVVEASSFEPLALNNRQIGEAAARLLPGAPIVAVDTLTEPDAYWYAVHGEVQLPVLRLRFGDPDETWIHIAPGTGELLSQADSRRRTYRWLFDFFHRWDLTLLLGNWPARELLIWLMSLVGLISSVTAVYIGWKRLRRPSEA